MDKFILIEPTDTEIDFYVKLWKRECDEDNHQLFTAGDTKEIDIASLLFNDKDTNYFIKDDGIGKMIKKKNYSLAVKTIDDVYSTQLKDGLKDAQDLINKKLVNQIRNEIKKVRNVEDKKESYKCRGKIVDLIADGKKQGTNNRYSFATKFCSFLAPDLFPIFDSISSSLIYQYLTEPVGDYRESFKVSKSSMGLYSYYLYVYDKFVEKYRINRGYKKVDIFLWMYGKAISNYWDNLGIITYSTSLYTSSDNKRAKSIIRKMEKSLESDKKTQNNA